MNKKFIGEFGFPKALSAEDFKLVNMENAIQEDIIPFNPLTTESSENLNRIRNSAAYLLAHAVKNLFPDVKIGDGTFIENGFFCDFFYSRSFTLEDLKLIEKEMSTLVKKDKEILKERLARKTAISLFLERGEKFKLELIQDLPEEELCLYSHGNFIDISQGPYLSSSGKLKAFKLMKVSGAYWRGKKENDMLQRIHGTAWETNDQQNRYLNFLENANKRDHRKIGNALHYFHFQEESPGLVFWHPHGWTLWQQIEKYLRQLYSENEYQEIKTPQILDLELWKKTGHWDNYKENIFTIHSENRAYGLKPMSCPGHVQIFNSSPRSYRDLPLRYSEFGQCHRNEPSGSLHGIMRVRGFTQDDGHIFCTESQLQKECSEFTSLVQKVYSDFGFREVLYKVSTQPEKYIGSKDLWKKAEAALIESLVESDCYFQINKGEGAFYGPKIEYTLKDAIGREWQCGTIQVDFCIPARLGAEYIDKDGLRQTPVMLHRAILGSFERFIAILIENYNGALPTWLAPVQIVVCCVSEKFSEYTSIITSILKKKRFRVESDLRSEKISRKIREYSLKKIPYVLVIGNSEQESKTVSVRKLNGETFKNMTVDMLIDYLIKDVEISN